MLCICIITAAYNRRNLNINVNGMLMYSCRWKGVSYHKHVLELLLDYTHSGVVP